MKGVGGDRQRHDGRRGADRGAGDQPGEGDDRDDEDDEGRRARGVDDSAERRGCASARAKSSPRPAGGEEDAERQADQRADAGRDRRPCAASVERRDDDDERRRYQATWPSTSACKAEPLSERARSGSLASSPPATRRSACRRAGRRSRRSRPARMLTSMAELPRQAARAPGASASVPVKTMRSTACAARRSAPAAGAAATHSGSVDAGDVPTKQRVVVACCGRVKTSKVVPCFDDAAVFDAPRRGRRSPSPLPSHG